MPVLVLFLEEYTNGVKTVFRGQDTFDCVAQVIYTTISIPVVAGFGQLDVGQRTSCSFVATSPIEEKFSYTNEGGGQEDYTIVGGGHFAMSSAHYCPDITKCTGTIALAISFLRERTLGATMVGGVVGFVSTDRIDNNFTEVGLIVY